MIANDFIRFFTTPYGNWDWHLIPYRKWRNGYEKKYKELIIDCGVNDLISRKDYRYIDEYPLLNLPENVYFVIPDYPHNVQPNLTESECIEKTRKNIEKWHKLPRSICSVQYKFENVESFIEAFNFTYQYSISNIIGIGNLCKSAKMSFLRKIIDYIINNNKDNKRIHFFSLFRTAIKYICQFKLNFEISFDTMKWDYGLHYNRLPGNSNTRVKRWEKFHEYIKDLIPTNKQIRLNKYTRRNGKQFQF